MKHRIYIGLITLALLVIGAFWLLRPRASGPSPVAQQPQSSTPTSQLAPAPQATPIFTTAPSEEVLNEKVVENEAARQAQEKAFGRAFDTPINFWGKVVDEIGNPVFGAAVKFGTADRPWEKGSSYERTTDASGLFSITGVKGLSISIDVSKDSYYRTPRSRGQISYSQPSGNKEPLPTSDKPMVFELRKMGEVVPLIEVTQRSIHVPKNGMPIEVDLATGKTMGSGRGGLMVECWTDNQNKNAQGHYNWRCRLSVPGGGLVERKDRYLFEAPAEGYITSEEVAMPQSSPEWRKGFDKEYFAKLPDNRYARFTFGLTTGGEHFFVFASYLNPTPGSRNLEYDAKKQLSSQ